MAVDFHIDHREVESRKELRRRVWAYRKVDHIPVIIEIYPSCGHTTRQKYTDLEAWYTCNVESIRRSLSAIPDDYIPCTHLIWGGFMTIATMFGMQVHWSEDPNQEPGVSERLITDIAQIHELCPADPFRDGQMPENLRWMRAFSERFPPDVYLAGLDLEGPLANAFSLMKEDLFFIGLKEHPKDLHRLLQVVTRTMISCLDALIDAAGGLGRMTCIDYASIWQPEGFKGYTSDDLCANISPAMFREFSLPYNNMIFDRYRGGLLHNCGPHPPASLYLHHTPPIHGLNCSYRYSQNDLQALREEFGPRAKEELDFKGHLEVLLEWQDTGEEMVSAFRALMEQLAPDIFAIPICMLKSEEWEDDEITQLYWEMRNVAAEFAGNIEWAAD
jgi:uroporphyrinogen-III decarboxylase